MTIKLKTSASDDDQRSSETKSKSIIGRNDLKITDGILTLEVMWAMGHINSCTSSPDGEKIVYVVTYFSIEENRGRNVIRIMDKNGTNDTLLTNDASDENNPQWIENGNKIAFISDVTNKKEIWTMNPDGTDRKKISSFDKDIESFLFSPDSLNVLFISQAPYIYHPDDLYKDLPKTTAMMANDLMYKHWDHWLETVPHPFYASYDGNVISTATDILEGTKFESPLLPFGGIEELSWTPDSKNIAYSCKKKAGTAYTLSTDSDIYLYNIDNKTEVNLCKLPGDPDQNMGYDMNPRFTNDGKYMAWLSMEHDGYESDKNRLYLMDLATKKKTDLTVNFDQDVAEFCWDNTTQTIYFTSVWHGRTLLFNMNLKGEYVQITEGDYDYVHPSMIGNKILCIRRSMRKAEDIFIIDPSNNYGIQQLTHENDHIFDQIKIGEVKERWTTTVDGKQLMSWVIYPADFDATKKYPALLMCMGGPQEACSQIWSNKWNFVYMANQGYIVVMPNRRGCPGFGREWTAEVSKDYGGLCMQDYFSSIDDMAKESYIDKDRLGCVGASFGGYSVYWLAGHHEKRFKAFLAHDGMFDFDEMYLATDEMWFENWDEGGSYWDKNNPPAKRSFDNSPSLFVDKWDTPILVIHSDKDYRIPLSQGECAFNAARLRNIDAEFLFFPDECHFVSKPQNSVLWNRVFFKWLDKYLK